MKTTSRIVLFSLLVVLLVAPACAATTSVQIVKYANDKTTILDQETVTWQQMRDTLPVLGDGVTHYYHQGPVFVDDPDEATEQALRWNPAEDINVDTKDMGAVKGTNVRDLCDLVGGMSEGEEVKLLAVDGWSDVYSYKNVYQYSSREGPMGLTWYTDFDFDPATPGKYVDSGYSDALRMVWFADDSVNPGGLHAFGNYDWHEAAAPEYWYYYISGGEYYPTTTGLSGKYINRIWIYSDDAPPVAPVASFSATPTSGTAPLTVQFTDASTGTGPLTYAWDFNGDDITDSTEQNPQVTFIAQGSYPIKLTVTGPGGSDDETKTNYITVYQTPVASFSSDVQTGTAPLTVQFTDASTGTGPLTYAWDFNNDAVIDSTLQNPSFIYSSAGMFTVKLTVTGPGGSDDETKTNYITVYQTPVASFSSDVQTGTAPLTVQFTDASTGTGPLTYAWDFNNDGMVDSTLQNPSFIYSSAGMFTVKLTVTGPGGSDDETKTNYITVYQTPVASFSSDVQTGTAPLTVQFTDASTGTGPLTYAWDFNNDGMVDSTLQNPSFIYSSAGMFTVKLTVTGPGGSDDETKTDYITVNPAPIKPVAQFSSDVQTGTAPLTVQFTDASTGTGPLTYAWDFNNDAVIDSTLQNPSFIYSSAGMFTVKLTVTGPGGSDDETKTDYITVNPAPIKPVAQFSSDVQTGTAPLTVQFTDASTGTGPLTYAWDFNNDAVIDSTLQNPSFIYSSAGTYTVKLTVTGPGGSDDETKTNYILVNPAPIKPVAQFSSDVQTGTAPLTVQFTDASTGTGPLTYAWDFNNDAVIDSTIQNPSFIYSSAGTYTVKLTVTGPGGSDDETKTNYILVNPAPIKPVASFSSDVQSGTAPLTVQFTDASTGTGPLTYAWDFNNDAVIDSTIQNPSFIYSSAGTFTVKLTVTGPGGSDDETKTNYILVNPAPIKPVAQFSSDVQSGTAPLTVQFTDASTGTGPLTYAWDFNDDGMVDSTLQNPSFIYSSAGTFTVKLTVTGPGGSDDETKTNYILVNPAPIKPVASFSSDVQSGTAPLTVQFTDASTGTGPLTYAWDFNDDGMVDSTLQNPSFIYSSAGTFTVKLTVTGPGGSDDETKTNYITVNPAPVVSMKVAKSASVSSLPEGGGDVTYTYIIENTGTADITAFTLTDDKLGIITTGPINGDINADGVFDAGETWTYSVQTFLAKTTTNTAKAEGRDPAGLIVTVFSNPVTVIVGEIAAPEFPAPAFPIMMIGIISMLAVLLKRRD